MFLEPIESDAQETLITDDAEIGYIVKKVRCTVSSASGFNANLNVEDDPYFPPNIVITENPVPTLSVNSARVTNSTVDIKVEFSAVTNTPISPRADLNRVIVKHKAESNIGVRFGCDFLFNEETLVWLQLQNDCIWITPALLMIYPPSLLQNAKLGNIVSFKDYIYGA